MKLTRFWIRIFAYSSGFGLLGKLGQFMAYTYLALVLAPKDFGVFSIAQILIVGAASIVSSSYSIAANRTAAALAIEVRDASKRKAIAYVLLYYWRQLMVIFAVSMVCIPLLFPVISGEPFAPWVIGVACLVPFIVVADIIVGVVAGSGGIRTSALLDGSRAISTGLIVVVLSMQFGYIGGAFGLVLADFALVALTILICNSVRRVGEISPLFGLESQSTVYAGIVSNGASQVASWVLIWFIQITFGIVAVGTYAVANRFATLVLIIPGFLSKNVVGELSRQVRLGERELVKRSVLIYIGTVIAIAALASSISLVVVTLGFEGLVHLYPGLISVLIVLLVGTSVRSIASGLGVVCVAEGQIGPWVLSDLVGMFAILTWIVISALTRLDLPGATYAVLFGASVCLLIRLVALVRRSRSLAGRSAHA